MSVKFENYQTSEMNEAQRKLKKCLTEAFIFRYPDFTKLFILYIDASKKDVDTILAQHDSEAKTDYVVKYFSQSLGQTQEN